MDASYLALACTRREIETKISEIEDRLARATTAEDVMTDAHVLKQYREAHRIVVRSGLGMDTAFLGFPKAKPET